MLETALNSMAQQYLDLTLCKSRYDQTDIQWYTEGPFWRRTNMRFSRDYKILPDYEIGDQKHGKTLNDILDESGHLIENLKLYQKTACQEQLPRVEFLIDHTVSLHARTRLLLGEKLSYNEMTGLLYNLVTPPCQYAELDAVLEELAQALPGGGALTARIGEFEDRITVPRDKILRVLQDCTKWFHERAVQNMTVTGNSMPRVRVREYPNPNMHFLSILFGYDYNHLEYERNFNTNFRWTADEVVECIGHEMEPGHLTFYEKRLQTMIDYNWPEMAVVSQFSPSSAFTEGSARFVIDLCFGHQMEKKVDFEREYILKNADMDAGLAQLMSLWHRYKTLSGYGKLEALRNVWEGIWSQEEAVAFLKHYAFVREDSDIREVDKLIGADWGHFTSHDYARDVIAHYFSATAATEREQWALYEDLCCAPLSMRRIAEK